MKHLSEIAVVVAVSLLAYLGEVALSDHLPWGAEARGVLAVLAGAAAAVWLTLAGGGRLADMGLRRPRRLALVPVQAIAILIAFVVAQNLAPLLVVPFFELESPDMSRYDYVRGNLPAAISLAVALPLTAAIPEEILYRGFLLGRLSRLLAGVPGNAGIAVLLQALVFGAVHFQWGPGGVFLATIMGTVWGFAFLLCGRNLWVVIVAHSMAHVALVAQLYYSAPHP